MPNPWLAAFSSTSLSSVCLSMRLSPCPCSPRHCPCGHDNCCCGHRDDHSNRGAVTANRPSTAYRTETRGHARVDVVTCMETNMRFEFLSQNGYGSSLFLLFFCLTVGLLLDLTRAPSVVELWFCGSVAFLQSLLTPQSSDDTVSSAQPPPILEPEKTQTINLCVIWFFGSYRDCLKTLLLVRPSDRNFGGCPNWAMNATWNNISTVLGLCWLQNLRHDAHAWMATHSRDTEHRLRVVLDVRALNFKCMPCGWWLSSLCLVRFRWFWTCSMCTAGLDVSRSRVPRFLVEHQSLPPDTKRPH